jgi:hypothetical protein
MNFARHRIEKQEEFDYFFAVRVLIPSVELRYVILKRCEDSEKKIRSSGRIVCEECVHESMRRDYASGSVVAI